MRRGLVSVPSQKKRHRSVTTKIPVRDMVVRCDRGTHGNYPISTAIVFLHACSEAMTTTWIVDVFCSG